MLSLVVTLFFGALLIKYVAALYQPHIKSLNYAPGGGGYPPAPSPPDYNAQAQANIQTQNNQARIDAESRAAADAKAASDLAAKRETFNSKQGSAYLQAQNYGQSRLNSMGIQDNYGIMPAYTNEIDRAKSAIPDLDPNPGNYFTPSLFDNALSSQRGVERGKLNKQFDQFAAPGFENQQFANTADDDIINSIINEQYGNANDFLTRAQSRGQLDSTGFDYAQQQLGNSRPGAVSRANDMGMGVLQKDRDMLTNLGTEGRNRITNWDFGDSFDPNSYNTRIRDTADQYKGRLEGDIRNTFGDTAFFDPTKLITKAGAFQGQANPGAAAPAGAAGVGGADDQLKRTTGSQGAF